MQQSKQQSEARLYKDLLYILIEGTPESPEKAFFVQAISEIWERQHLNLRPEIVEVGGSSEFRAFAKVGYRLSQIHQTVPVLAIFDSDYRTDLDKKQKDNSSLIEKRLPKILYWPRHEWENYLLEETKWLADWVNQIPSKSHNGRFYKTSPTVVDYQQLDDFLLNYFRQLLRTEYWECLKFNLVRQVDKYPSVVKPGDFDTTKNISEIKQWFENQANQLKGEVTFKAKLPTLFDDIMQELPWQHWLTSSKLVDLPLAKQRFRGKEAFEALCEFLKKEFGIHNLKKDSLTKDLLRHLAGKVDSAIFQDLQNLLLLELR